MAGRFSICVRETTLSFWAEDSILVSLSSLLFSGLTGGVSAVKSNPGIGNPTLPLAGESVIFNRSSAVFNDSIELPTPPGE